MAEEVLCDNCGLAINMANMSNPNCVRCNHPDGTPKTKDEIKYGILSYFINEMQLSTVEAKEAAEPYIAKL